MKTVGLVIKNARVGKGLNLSDVAKATKIKEKVLSQIEADKFFEFSSFGHLLGLVKNYGEFLGQDPDYLTALLRRQVASPKIQKPAYFALPNLFPFFRTPAIAVFILISVFIYLAFQLINLRTGPKLEVFQPQAGTVVNLAKIQITGVTDPEAQVTVNGQKIPTNTQGEFSLEFELQKGINLVEIVAKKGQSSETKIVRTVELTD